MQKSNQLCMCSLLLVSVFITSGCNVEQPNPFNEKFEYFQKPMRNLDPQLMDEILEYAPDEIKDLIDVIDKSDMKESLRVMLVGSPGVGKTTLAQAIALQTGRPCYIVRAPSLSNQFQFSGEQNLIAAINPLFEQKEPCIVIIDEIDALKQYKGDKANQDASPANTLCNLLDDAEDHPHVIFIATTNKLKQIPEDLKSRFGTVVTLPLPDKEARERIIRYHLRELKKAGIAVDLDEDAIKQLASKTEGFSAREIKAMILKGKIKARKAGDLLQEQQIMEAYKAEKPLIGSAWHIKEKLIEFTKEHGVAIALSIVGTAVGAAVGIYGLVQHARSMEHQRQLEMKAKRDGLMKAYIAQGNIPVRLIQFQGRTPANSKERKQAVWMSLLEMRILMYSIKKTMTIKGSMESKYFKKIIIDLKSVAKHDEIQKDFVDKWLKAELSVSNILARIQLKKGVIERYDEKFDEMLRLAKICENATSMNAANERSEASSRERNESWWDRLSMGVLTSYISGWLQRPQ